MSGQFSTIKSIAVAKEISSPENPGGLEKRVALVPEDVQRLIATGLNITVEEGAGIGVDFSDQEYIAVGAKLETSEDIYKNKDLIIKFKGPALSSIKDMRAGGMLFCMAHFHSFPQRAKMLAEAQINVLAMEEILESPKTENDEEVLGRVAMAKALEPFIENNSMAGLRVRVIGWSKRLSSGIRRAGNRDPRSLGIVQQNAAYKSLSAVGSDALYFYDSETFEDPLNILKPLAQSGTHLFDISAFTKPQKKAAIATYRENHPPSEYGMRRIQCLHETGQAGARYGLELLKTNKPKLETKDVKMVVLGYGNVARGAIHEVYDHGVADVAILGRTHTNKDRIKYWLKNADLVINGADQPPNLRGINYLISNDHISQTMTPGSVIIDLVGGSANNRSPVEAVLDCTFLDAPAFTRDGITISALWGWPMLGMMRETAIRYSGQITDVLMGSENVLNGPNALSKGAKRALVCGPF
jgi:alanine dehydrogenase